MVTGNGMDLDISVYDEAGKNNFAFDNFTKAHSLDPVSVDITMDFASFLSQIGKTDKALDLLKSLEGVKDNPKLLYNIGCIFMDALKYGSGADFFDH